VWKFKEMDIETTINVWPEYMVLSLLLYNSETTTLKATTMKKLLVLEMSCFRRIKGATRRQNQKCGYQNRI